LEDKNMEKVTDFNEVLLKVKELMPDCVEPLTVCLSLVGASMLEDVDHCIGVILVGQSGGRKTTTLRMLGDKDPFYWLNNFTPASFVSHDATKTEAQLQKIDLLPRIIQRIMVIPEMAPIFEQRYEDLNRDIAVLTAVMDGQGYQTESGTHGHRGYTGDNRFGMLAGTTPLPTRAWQSLGKLGSRWLFYRLPDIKNEPIDLKKDHGAIVNECREIVTEFISNFWVGYASKKWDKTKEDDNLLELIAYYARHIVKWRGLMVKQDTEGYNPPMVEVPYRLTQTLYALARGHALIHGRELLEKSDVDFVSSINESNIPEERVRIYRAFSAKASEKVNQAGGMENEKLFEIFKNTVLGLREAARAMGCSEDKAKRVLEELEGLEVVEKTETGEYRRTVI
jgi:hypothetical protein